MTDLQAQAREILAAEFDKMKAGAAAKDIRGGPSCFHVVLTRIALRAIVAALQSRADGPPYPSDDWQANGRRVMAEPYQMSPELVAAIERARSYVMTPEERFEQCVSFVFGQQDHDDPHPCTKDEIRQYLIGRFYPARANGGQS